MKPGSIRSILIAGGGIVAWSAAAALRRKIPAIAVTVVPVPPPADALADRVLCTLPSIAQFHDDIGLTEADTVVRAGSSFRLGTRFEQWVEGGENYIHAYGAHGEALGSASFHHYWLRALRDGRAAPFEAYSAAAAMAARGRFVHPEAVPDPQFASVGYGLHITPERYRTMMRAYALHLGATERAGIVAGVHLRAADGFVEAIEFADTDLISADLFIDATGPQALIRSVVDEQWEDWSGWLRADRVLFADGAAAREPSVLDRAVALPSGWRWEAAGLTRTSHGLVYSSAYLADDEAQRLLGEAAGADPTENPVVLRPGRRSKPWLRNCVAIGDAAVAIEPLEWTNLHLAHSAIDRIVSMMPDRDCSPVELWNYNRQVNDEADRARDFVALHYATAQRSSDEFWKDASSRALTPSLEHTLTQFRERGRLPFYEEETFSRDSWVAVLLGQRVLPRRVDPLVDTVPEPQAEAAMARMRTAIEAAVEKLPLQSHYLDTMARRVPR